MKQGAMRCTGDFQQTGKTGVSRGHGQCGWTRLIAGWLLTAVAAQGAVTNYVAPNGVDDGTKCTNAATPCATIQHAISVASAGDEIQVAAGVYTQGGIVVDRNVAIRGAGARECLVQAAADVSQATQRVFAIPEGATASLEGLTIANGREGGAGVSHPGGGILNSGTVDFTHTLFSNNSSYDYYDAYGEFNSLGYILIEDPCGFTITGNTNGNVVAAGACLDELRNYGGPTDTHAIWNTSPAENAGDPDFAEPPSTDQRGQPRVNGGGSIDIGAYELEYTPLILVSNRYNGVWINGVFEPHHLMKGSYEILWSPSSLAGDYGQYILQESFSSNFSPVNQYWVLDGNVLSHLQFLKTNGTYYYRVRCEHLAEWSAVTSVVVDVQGQYPPTTPAITGIVKNIRSDVWKDGQIISNYVHQGDYMIHMTESASGEGVNCYEIHEVRDIGTFTNIDAQGFNPAWFTMTNPPARLYAPPYPSPEHTTNYDHPVHQIYLQGTGTYHYRAQAVDVNGFKSPWSTIYPGPYPQISVIMTNPYPPTVPQISGIELNFQKMVFDGDSLVTHTAKANYMIHLTIAESGDGVNCYEIQETQDPAWFHFVDTDGYPAAWFTNPAPPVRIYAPPYPQPGNTNDHPIYQVFLQSNGTYYCRVQAVDINGFKSPWNTAYPGPYSNITIAMQEPYPPNPPVITSNGCQSFDGDIYVSFDYDPTNAGENVNGYLILLSTDPSFSTTTDLVFVNSPYYTWEGLPAGTYYVRACVEDWNGFQSDWSSTITLTNDIVPVVSGFRVEQVVTNTAVARWTTDIPCRGEVERRGMYHLFKTWVSPTQYVQGVDYAPAEAYGAAITTNDIIRDLEQLRAHNVNVLNLYNIGWEQLQKNGNVEKFIFDKARALGMKIVMRMEVYNKYHPEAFLGAFEGNNCPEKHFAYRTNDVEWILDYYTTRANIFGSNGYVNMHSDVILYWLINLPFDDTELVRSPADGFGLTDFPDRQRQREYVQYFYNRLKELDPADHPVYANVFYSGADNLPHFELADILDGISVVQYPERLDGYCRSYGYVPGAEDPDCLLLTKDNYEYHFDKHYAVNQLDRYRKPVVIDQTGLCEVNNAETGRVKDKRAKARALDALAEFMARNTVIDYGWSCFQVHDKFDENGEWATWGLVDRSNEFLDEFEGGVADWTVISGSWSAAGGMYGSSGSGTEIALIGLGQKKGGVEAQFHTGSSGSTNVYLVFSFQDSANYRYTGYDGDNNRYVIGEVSNGVDATLASTYSGSETYATLKVERAYTLRAVINFTRVRLDVDLNRRVVELNLPDYRPGRVGLMTRNTQKPFWFFKTYGRLYCDGLTTNHTFVLRELYPGTEYNVRAASGGGHSAYSNFTTLAETALGARPSITVTRPAFGHELAAVNNVRIEWIAWDPAGDALIDLYYDRNEKAEAGAKQAPAADDYKGRCIAAGLKATNGVPCSYTWNLDVVPPGSYYIRARIYRPGAGVPDEYDYSSGRVIRSPEQIPAVFAGEAATNIALNGVLDDPAWTNAQAFVYAQVGSAPTATIASVRALWNDKYLYLGFNVADAALASYLGVWDSDGAGCMLDNGRQSLNRMDIMGRDVVRYIGATSNDMDWGGTDIVLATNASGYQIEMRLQWTSLRTIPQPMTVIPADFILLDRNSSGISTYRSWDGSDDEHVAGKSLLLVDSLDEFPQGALYVAIGTNDGASAEFDPAAPYTSPYYPARMAWSDFPRELNTSAWRTQDIAVAVDTYSADRGLLLTLDAAQSAGSAAMNVQVRVLNAGGTGTVATVALSPSAPEYVSIPASNLAVGANTIRLYGQSGAAWLYWDRIAIEPDRYTVRLACDGGVDGFPQAQADRTNFTAAACCWMIAKHLKGAAFSQTQTNIYNATAHDPAHNHEITPPSCAAWMADAVGDPYWFIALSRTNFENALRQVVYWMDYEPPGGEKTPAYMVCGSDWAYKVGRGFQSDRRPYDGGGGACETGAPYTVYGMWLNDPKVSGLGYNVYVTAAALASVFTPSAAGGRYWFVVDPPKDAAQRAEAMARIERLRIELAPEEPNVAVASQMRTAARAGCDSESPSPNLRAVLPHALLNDAGFMEAFDRAGVVHAYAVNEGAADEYNLLAGGVRGPASTTHVLLMSPNDGALRQATWSDAATLYPPVPLVAAEWISRQNLGDPDALLLSAKLAYSAGADASPFLPRWVLEFDSGGKAVISEVAQAAVPRGDRDGDGAGDLAELYAGSDPEDKGSVFGVFTDPATGAEGIVLRWASRAGASYSIHWTTDLCDGFSVLQSHIAATPPENVHVPAAASLAGYYRVEVE